MLQESEEKALKYVKKIEHCFQKLTEQCKKNTDLNN